MTAAAPKPCLHKQGFYAGACIICGVTKRSLNTAASTQLLIDKGVPFTSHNNGAHLVVDGRFDFWPSTGLWIARNRRSQGRGVFVLLRQLEQG